LTQAVAAPAQHLQTAACYSSVPTMEIRQTTKK